MCSDMLMPTGLPVSPKYSAPHSHGSQYIMFFVSNVEILSVVLLRKLPMVFQEQKAVHLLPPPPPPPEPPYFLRNVFSLQGCFL